MGLLFISVFFCILNILLWIFLLARFNKKFSTDDIIHETRIEMNNLIADVNRNTGRAIELLDDKIRELKALSADVDRHISVIKNEQKKADESFQFSQSINKRQVRTPVDRYLQNSMDYMDEGSIVSSSGTQFVIQNDMPQVTFNPEPIKVEKDFNTRVRELWNQGNTIDEIASLLSSSTTEVQFAIDMGD